MIPRLEVHDLSKAFPEVKALERVSLDVRPGEVHALLGENGAGKSTLGKIIAGVYARDEGSVSLDGAPLGDIDEAEAGRLGIGIVHQEGSSGPNALDRRQHFRRTSADAFFRQDRRR